MVNLKLAGDEIPHNSRLAACSTIMSCFLFPHLLNTADALTELRETLQMMLQMTSVAVISKIMWLLFQ